MCGAGTGRGGIEVLRQHYRKHRDALARMMPMRRPSSWRRSISGSPRRSMARSASSMSSREGDGIRYGGRSGAGVRRDAADGDGAGQPAVSLIVSLIRGLARAGDRSRPRRLDGPLDRPSNNGSRMLLMLLIAVAVLGIIGWLIWRASSDKKKTTPQVIEQPA